MRRITSRHNPLVKRYREAAAGSGRDMVLDGIHLIEEAALAGVGLHAIASTARGLELAGVRSVVERVQTAGVDLYCVTDDVLRAMSPVKAPSGVIALAARPAVTLAAALDRQPALAIVAVDVQDPGNVGAIVRAADAGGATAAILAGASADAFGWKALRGSMGSAFRLPVVRATWADTHDGMRARGLRLVATSPRGGRSLFESDLRGAVALLVGGEGPGLSRDVLLRADDTVHIPMREPVESLNVAVAAALMVYEAARQRGTLR